VAGIAQATPATPAPHHRGRIEKTLEGVGAVSKAVYDLLVVGGGPAGLASARTASDHGLSVVVIDERPTLGGQIYKQFGRGFVPGDPRKLGRDYRAGRALIDSAQSRGVTLMTDTSAVAIRDLDVEVVTGAEHATTITAQKILIAPGAHDRPVAFPGWTLPGVITAGAAQTLVKTQRVLPGSRIMFAGSGPLALAFPAQLVRYGANVVAALEAGPAPTIADLAGLALAARGNVHLLRDAAGYRATLLRHRVPLQYRRIVVRAIGTTRVERVVHAQADADWRPIAGTEQTVEADTLCIGYGFIPSVELLRLAGCGFDFDENLGGLVVRLDDWMRTTTPHVYSAGDGAGVEGVYVAMAQGRIAATAAAADLGRLSADAAAAYVAPLRKAVQRKRRFASSLTRMYSVGDGVFELADAETVVCRCEEVRQGDIDAALATSPDLMVAKNLTRAGMGMCQGRNCQRHIAATIARQRGVDRSTIPLSTPRFPVRPIALGAIADDQVTVEKFFTPVEVSRSE
jgi:D-hydroxyproline dehydrogenase subunit alpha